MCCEIDFDAARAVPRMLEWVPEIDSGLTAGDSSLVRINLNLQFIGGNVDTGVLVYPIGDIGQHPRQERLVEMRRIAKREIEIF